MDHLYRSGEFSAPVGCRWKMVFYFGSALPTDRRQIQESRYNRPHCLLHWLFFPGPPPKIIRLLEEGPKKLSWKGSTACETSLSWGGIYERVWRIVQRKSSLMFTLRWHKAELASARVCRRNGVSLRRAVWTLEFKQRQARRRILGEGPSCTLQVIVDSELKVTCRSVGGWDYVDGGKTLKLCRPNHDVFNRFILNIKKHLFVFLANRSASVYEKLWLDRGDTWRHRAHQMANSLCITNVRQPGHGKSAQIS